MTKTRLEAFSDGVFAIAITLLILNVNIPDINHLNNVQLNAALVSTIPHLITFCFSFLVVGVFWVAHHRIFNFVKVVDITLLWLNIVYLMFIAIIPFPASILASHPLLISSILIYTVTLFIIGIMHLVILRYMSKNTLIMHESLTNSAYRLAFRTSMLGPACYILAALSCFLSPFLSFFFIIGSMVFHMFFSGRGKLKEK